MSAPAARLYLSLALVAGPLVVVATPPFQVPDEPAHWLRVVQVSEGTWMGERRSGEAGGELPRSIAESYGTFMRLREDRKARTSRDELLRWMRDKPFAEAPHQFTAFPNTVLYSPVPYLPGAAAVAVARTFHAAAGAAFYAARFATLFAATALIAVALAIAPSAIAWPLAVLALLPMSEALLGSVSGDAMTIALAVANVALAASLAQEGTSFSSARVLALAVTAAGLALTKPVYAPFGCATALIAASSQRRASTLAGSFLFAGVLPLAAGFAWTTAAGRLYVPLLPGLSAQAQASWALAHPGSTLLAVGGALLSPRHGNELIGVLGWLEAPVPIAVRVVELIALIGVPLVAGAERPLRLAAWARVVALAAVVGMALLIGIAMLLTWNVPGAKAIAGVQGRYYLPLYALAVMALPPLPLRVRSGLTVASTAVAGVTAAGGTLFTLYRRYWS